MMPLLTRFPGSVLPSPHLVASAYEHSTYLALWTDLVAESPQRSQPSRLQLARPPHSRRAKLQRLLRRR